MPSVRNIAKQAGVSIATVSRALNNDPGISEATRMKILAIANSRGYRGGNGKRVATNIAFAYSGEQKLSHPFESAVLQGASQGLEDSQWNIVLLNLKREKERSESFTQFFLRHNVAGVMLRVVAESRNICETIAAEGFPHVVISERFDSPNVCYCDCDSKLDSIKAVEYLIALGHRRIAYASHNIPDRDHSDRFEGYKEALLAHGIEYHPDIVFSQPSSLAGGVTVVKMAASMAERPTAIYFADWMLTIGGLKAAHELGIQVPRDLSIVGFDDANMRQTVHPTLTSVCQNAIQLGCEAARNLARVLNGETKDPFQILIPSFFEIYESTGTPSEMIIRANAKDRLGVERSSSLASSSDGARSIESQAG